MHQIEPVKRGIKKKSDLVIYCDSKVFVGLVGLLSDRSDRSDRSDFNRTRQAFDLLFKGRILRQKSFALP